MTFLRRNWKSISSGMTQNRELYCLIGKIHDFLIWDPNLSRGTFLSQVKFIKLAINKFKCIILPIVIAILNNNQNETF